MSIFNKDFLVFAAIAIILFTISYKMINAQEDTCIQHANCETLEQKKQEDSKKIQSIRLSNADMILCSSIKTEPSYDQNVKCIISMDNIPSDSEFEFWFSDGTIIKLDKSKFINIISSQSKQDKQ